MRVMGSTISALADSWRRFCTAWCGYTTSITRAAAPMFSPTCGRIKTMPGLSRMIVA